MKSTLPKLMVALKGRFKKQKAIILLYHRIAEVASDPHLLAVTPKIFTTHLAYLKSNYQLISLETLVANLRRKIVPRNAIAITFDDGYADNLHQAAPVLKRLILPATFFVTAGKVGSSGPFYWDKKTAKADRGRPLNQQELKRLSRNPLFAIGSHTLTHSHLSRLNLGQQKREVKESKKQLEKIIDKKVDWFSYPFGAVGDYADRTVAIVKQSGYQGACANVPGLITNQTDPFELPRFIVRNWPINQFTQELRKFSTYEHPAS